MKLENFCNMKIGYDVVGNIAILKFSRDAKLKDKKEIAWRFLKEHRQVTTALEKVGKFSGRLRTQKTRWLAGEKTKEALYRENGCEFRFNVESCYFSPRLSEERKSLSEIVKPDERVLIMFGGVAPFAIVIAKKMKEKSGRKGGGGKVVSVELGRECNKYALHNVRRNKLQEIVEVVQGNVRRVIGNGKKISEEFDRIVMARPQLKDSFLDVAFSVIKKGGIIHYYGFCKEDELQDMKKLIIEESRKASRRVRILKVSRAGDIGPYRWRYRVDFKVLG